MQTCTLTRSIKSRNEYHTNKRVYNYESAMSQIFPFREDIRVFEYLRAAGYSFSGWPLDALVADPS